jgi:hypothetical protein
MVLIDHKEIQERIVTIIGFSGVILGLILNGVNKLSYGDSTYIFDFVVIPTLILLALTIVFLLLSMVIGLTYYIYTQTTTKEEPEIGLRYSQISFVLGLLSAGMFIFSYIWQTILPSLSVYAFLFTIFCFLIILIAFFMVNHNIDKELKNKRLNAKNEKNNMQCNYLKAEKSDPAKSNPDIFRCLINPQIEYDPEIREVCRYCKTDNFVNCPRVKIIQIKS